ncbi:MAG: Gfo/Idh/MocA family oxidoreductase [Hyphomicrobiales bacterium]|nr:Gfo/Idh/MocA family oxidoreductase [Hyphomicrobiales bacterium]
MLAIAMVGLGGWGRRIVEAVQGKSGKVRIHAAVVSRPERSRGFAETHDLELTSDYDAILGNDAIQAVISCGPAPLHATHSLAALQAGKSVLAIKPLAQTAKEALALEQAAEDSGALLALGYDRCFYPNVAEMRRRLQSGVLGRLLHAEGNFCVDRYGSIEAGSWKSDPDQVTAGSLADHMLYLMIETLGPIAEVYTMTSSDISPNKLADTSAVLLRTTSQATGMLTAIGTTAEFFRFQVFGTGGWLQLQGADKLIIQPADGQREELSLTGPDPLLSEVEAFADAVTGRKNFPVTMHDAVHSAAVLEAMDKSARTDKPVIL